MTAAVSSSAATRASGLGAGLFLGLGNVLRKDVGEWLRGRRFWVVLIVSTLIYMLTAANAWITNWLLANLPAAAGEVRQAPLPIDPMTNVIAPLATQFHVLVAIFATISLIIAEREGGTLAWTISKPVSRASVLMSKWLSATGLVWLSGVAIPLAATVAVVVALYGSPDFSIVAVLGVGVVAVVALFVAVSLVAATIIPSQAGVAAVGLAVFALPSLIGGLVPAIEPFLPTSIGSWVAGIAVGASVSPVTPLSWLLALGVLFAVGRARFASMEL